MDPRDAAAIRAASQRFRDTRQADQSVSLARIEARLKRVESKLDQLLGRDK